jgi:AmmeMemoRadiSam system protein B
MGTDSQRVRPAAVAGRFYDANPSRLRADVERHLAAAASNDGPAPKAIIAPHAGYVFSGPIAGSAFAALRPVARAIRRVILIGPAHYVPITGLAFPDADAFATPLGNVCVDRERVDQAVRALPQALVLNSPHRPEHSLEVELPFLQVLLEEFEIVPVLVGDVTGGEVADLLRLLWGGPETCIVVSSDLSHYLSYDAAREIDGATAAMIGSMDVRELNATRACGYEAIGGLVPVAAERGLKARVLDLRNSGDTAGSRDRVVGYGAFAFTS